MEIIKKFNVNEYTSWILSKASPHNAIVAASINTPIDELQFRKALDIAASEEPNLKLSISPFLSGFTTCKNTISLDFSLTSETWQKSVEYELNKPFQEGDALLRVRVIKTNRLYYILLCFHHIICDGKSAIEFLLTIFNIYNNNLLSVEKPRTCAKNIVDFFPFQCQQFSKIKYNSNNNITKIDGIILSKNIINSIIKYGKFKNQSVNSILSSFIINSYQKTFCHTENLNLHISIDLRRFEKNKNLGFHTSWINILIKNQYCLKELAYTVGENIVSSLQKNEHINNLILLNNIINKRIDERSFIDQFISKSPTLGISNCGNIRVPEPTSGIKISEIHLAANCQSYLGTQNSFMITIATVNNNSLSINVCYPSPLVSSQLVAIFLKNLHKIIHSFI